MTNTNANINSIPPYELVLVPHNHPIPVKPSRCTSCIFHIPDAPASSIHDTYAKAPSCMIGNYGGRGIRKLIAGHHCVTGLFHLRHKLSGTCLDAKGTQELYERHKQEHNIPL